MVGMAHTLRAFVLGTFALASPLSAQDLAYLAQVPTARQVAEGLAVASPRETAARRYAALFAMENLVGSLLGTRAPTPQERQRMSEFSAMRDQVYEMEKQRDPVPYLLERCSQAYSDSPGYQRELLDLYTTPGWQATYGSRLDPRRWKAALAMAPGVKVTAASMTPPMTEDCGSVPAAVVPRTAAATAPSQDPVKQLWTEAHALMERGDTAGAIEASKRLVAAYPSRAEGYSSLGRIYVAQHRYDAALPAWQKVVELEPTDGTPMLLVGSCYANLGRYAEALPVYRALLRTKTASPTVLAQTHYMMGLAWVNWDSVTVRWCRTAR